MFKKVVSTTGRHVVVWYWTHDSSETAPKLLHDLRSGERLLSNDDITLRFDVTMSDVWVLSYARQRYTLTRYYADGREEVLSDLPDDIDDALRPWEGVPANVWARTVAEMHDTVCRGRQDGCGCTETRRKLDKDGLWR